jgi:hypothetical protein
MGNRYTERISWSPAGAAAKSVAVTHNRKAGSFMPSLIIADRRRVPDARHV